jgi:asparagine synthase (glutamine-hydrolysing)
MRVGYVPAPLSIYLGVHKLPAGAILTLRAGGEPVMRYYWTLEAVARAGQAARLIVDDSEAAERLDVLLRDAVRRHMVADVGVGAFLSGGIDSSSVAAAMQAESTRPVRTFSIGFREPAFDEARYAAAVARHLGTEHEQLYVTPEAALSVIPRLPEMYDEPFADSSQIPTFLLAAMTRRHVTVALSGDGGDELFAGYDRYFTAAPVVARSATLGRAWYRLLVSQWPAPAQVVRDAAVPKGPLDDPAADDLVPDPVERLQYLDTLTYLPDDILTKMDRATMAVSLEARVPLLDHRLVEFAWTLPASLKGRDGAGRRVLRRVLDRYVPRVHVDRPKVGFAPPINAWLRNGLREWAEDLLDEKRLNADGILHASPVRAAWLQHLAGNGRAMEPPHALWAVLMFQAWKQRWLH